VHSEVCDSHRDGVTRCCIMQHLCKHKFNKLLLYTRDMYSHSHRCHPTSAQTNSVLHPEMTMKLSRLTRVLLFSRWESVFLQATGPTTNQPVQEQMRWRVQLVEL
jgi:hypothetical protein